MAGLAFELRPKKIVIALPRHELKTCDRTKNKPNSSLQKAACKHLTNCRNDMKNKAEIFETHFFQKWGSKLTPSFSRSSKPGVRPACARLCGKTKRRRRDSNLRPRGPQFCGLPSWPAGTLCCRLWKRGGHRRRNFRHFLGQTFCQNSKKICVFCDFFAPKSGVNFDPHFFNGNLSWQGRGPTFWTERRHGRAQHFSKKISKNLKSVKSGGQFWPPLFTFSSQDFKNRGSASDPFLPTQSDAGNRVRHTPEDDDSRDAHLTQPGRTPGLDVHQKTEKSGGQFWPPVSALKKLAQFKMHFHKKNRKTWVSINYLAQQR